jgi:hypothetical protein
MSIYFLSLQTICSWQLTESQPGEFVEPIIWPSLKAAYKSDPNDVNGGCVVAVLKWFDSCTQIHVPITGILGNTWLLAMAQQLIQVC